MTSLVRTLHVIPMSCTYLQTLVLIPISLSTEQSFTKKKKRQEREEKEGRKVIMAYKCVCVRPSEGNFGVGQLWWISAFSGVIILREIELLRTLKASQRLRECLCLWGPCRGTVQGDGHPLWVLLGSVKQHITVWIRYKKCCKEHVQPCSIQNKFFSFKVELKQLIRVYLIPCSYVFPVETGS